MKPTTNVPNKIQQQITRKQMHTLDTQSNMKARTQR